MSDDDGFTYDGIEGYLRVLFGKQNPKIKKNNDVLDTIISNTPEIVKDVSLISGPYDFVKNDTYGLTLDDLRKSPSRNPKIMIDGKEYVRPLSALETALARVQDDKLYDNYFDTCTGVVYSGDGKLKIVQESEDLIKLPKDFKDNFLSLDYDSVKGIEIDYKNSKHKYKERLTESEALEHEFYKAIIPDSKIRERYIRKTFQKLKQKHSVDEGMVIYLRSNPEEGEIRALLFCSNIDYYDAHGFNNLSFARFVRVAPPK